MNGKALLIKHKIKTGLISDIRQLLSFAKVIVIGVSVSRQLEIFWQMLARLYGENVATSFYGA